MGNIYEIRMELGGKNTDSRFITTTTTKRTKISYLPLLEHRRKRKRVDETVKKKDDRSLKPRLTSVSMR